jgi:endonuclease/exonuclease/phosphatase family metal-dependent hydrolase
MSSPTDDPNRRGTLRVASFNIRCDVAGDGTNAWPYRRDAVRSALREWACDVVGCQEPLPHQLAQLIDDLPGYGVISRSRDAATNTGEAVPIFYRADRWTIDPVRRGTFWLSETPDVPGSVGWDASLPRVATWARIVCKSTGRGVTVYNVHLDHRGEVARHRGMQTVVDHIRSTHRHGEQVIVLGDFNAEPGSPPLRVLSDAGLVDAAEAAETVDVGNGRTFHGWLGEPGEERIDYVYASRELRPLAVRTERRRVAGAWLSDHFPVIVDFAWHHTG